MKTAARRSCALALLLLALASAGPPLVPPETEALPAFDDADGSDGASAPILFLSSPAVLPSATPRFDACSDGAAEERVLEARVPEDAGLARPAPHLAAPFIRKAPLEAKRSSR